VNSPKDIEIAGQKVHNGMISALLRWNAGTGKDNDSFHMLRDKPTPLPPVNVTYSIFF
jgi:hypothetical protein